jgi:hypothetical protein
VLVHRTVVQHAADADEHLIEMPGVTSSGHARRSLLAKPAPTFKHQCPDALVGDHDPTFCQDQLNVAQAETGYVIQPDGMADDLSRKPMPMTRGGFVAHAVTFARLLYKRQRQLSWQCQLAATSDLLCCRHGIPYLCHDFE